MMYAIGKEGGSTGAAYTQTFLSEAATVLAEVWFFLQFMLLEKVSSELKGFCRGQQYNSLTCYTQEGSLAQKPLEFASSSKK